jgi:transposase
MKEYYLLMGLNQKEVKITKVSLNNNSIIEVKIESGKVKVRCPFCHQLTSSVHDKLKPIRSVYLESCGSKIDLIIYKKRYHCYKCNKTFTEDLSINTSEGNISNKVKIKIRKDLLNYNLSLKYISEQNRVSIYTVESELLGINESIPKYVINLPRVISFDEFKADTNEGKYAFIINDPIHKKVLDILPNRKKEYLIQYFTYCKNRHSVEFVISDMYEPYLLVQQIMFPKAKYVVDRYHYTTYIMDALDNIRIRLQKTYGENSKEYRTLKSKKNVGLLRKYSNEINWYIVTQRYKNGHMIDVLPIDVRNDILKISKEL